MNNLSPLTTKQSLYITTSLVSWLNILEGGKRGGKNVVNVLAFCIAVDNHDDKLHLAAGVSVATAKLNIIDCDGLGVLNYFKGRCREGKFKERDCVFVSTLKGEKIILISGGGKLGDEKLIKGNSYGTAIVTEINECHPLFVKEVFDRTMSSSNRKIFGDFNPKAPAHWFYEDVLEFHTKKQEEDANYGLNYAHVTIADNLSLTEDQIKAVLATYDKGSVWYRRDILGLRAVAEGVIFRQFANDPSKYITENVNDNLSMLSFGVDWGGNKSKTTFVCAGITPNFGKIYIVKDAKIGEENSTIDPEYIYQQFYYFYVECVNEFPTATPFAVFCDSAEQILINGLYKYMKAKGIPVKVGDCDKKTINERIFFKNSMLNSGRYFVRKNCEHVIASTKTQVWDSKQKDDVRLDDGTCDIDTADGEEYSWSRLMLKFQGKV